MMIITSAFSEVAIPDVTLPEYVLAHASERGPKPAIVDGASGRALTYAELASGVRRCAAGLAARGLRPGDVFAIMMPNLPEFAIAYHGALSAGGVVTTLSPLATADEAAHQLADTSARFLLTVPPCLRIALAAAEKAGVERVFVLGAAAPGASAFSELLGHGDTPPAVRIDPSRDLAALLCSSGTTGWPKGVMLTHRALVAALVELDRLTPFGEQERPICPIPFFHMAGQAVGMNKVLQAGATVVTMPRFDVESFLALIQQYRATAVLGAPPIVLALAKHPLVDRYDLSSLEKVVSGSASLSAQLQTACAQRLGRFVGQAYGLTETALIISAAPHDGRPARPGSAGMLVPNTEARVVDATGADLPAGEVGELWVRGPQLMSGYLGNPDATAETLDADGWLHTGDLVRIDADGWLFVVDRVKELIKYKGHQVAPAQLEALLGAHPAVADCAVVGRPDEAAGEIPVAYVVRRRDVDAAELIDHVAERVSPHHRVRAVEFVDEIPRSPAGKILRRMLADRERS
jgi:acyl-CoA synthetase (AMP-forming)/AMP-acid ligase II